MTADAILHSMAILVQETPTLVLMDIVANFDLSPGDPEGLPGLLGGIRVPHGLYRLGPA